MNLAKDVAENNAMMMRPLFDAPRGFETEYMFGPDLLVCPVTADVEQMRVWLPSRTIAEAWGKPAFKAVEQPVPGHRGTVPECSWIFILEFRHGRGLVFCIFTNWYIQVEKGIAMNGENCVQWRCSIGEVFTGSIT